MQKTIKNKSSSALIMLCWLVYTCSYIGKVNYASAINQVIDFFKVNTDIAGLVSTCFFFSGQVIVPITPIATINTINQKRNLISQYFSNETISSNSLRIFLRFGFTA